MKLSNLLSLFLLYFLSSCVSSNDLQNANLKPETFYKRDMIITVNGIVAEGALVIPKADKYDFKIEARGNLDLFTMTSCHKEETKEKAWNVQTTVKSGLFGWGSKKIDVPTMVTFTYIPTDMEKDGHCTLEFGGYEKEKGRNSWAFVDFTHPSYVLSALVECNGIQYNSNGTTVCQAKNGLIERLRFPEAVTVASSNTCGIVNGADKTTFEFQMPLGKCVAIFATESQPKKFHKLTLLGYEQILIRE